jgi:hypothetical protein
MNTFSGEWSGNAPLGNINDGLAGALLRYIWRFSSATLVNAIMFYTATPGWQSEYIKFEIVASNDGINFVRLPTEWNVPGVGDTVEDTFHIKYDRRNKGGAYMFLFADDASAVVGSYGKSADVSSGKYMLLANSVRAMVGTLTFVNATKYIYYGLGNVGSDTPYADRNVPSDTRTRTYTRSPFSNGYAGTMFTDAAWLLDYPEARAVCTGAELMFTKMPWLYYQHHSTFMFPVVWGGGSGAVASPTYKIWRLRATSAFIGTCGAASRVYVWKMGLYRDVATANADTYGISSNNYIQQHANALRVSTDGSTPTTIASGDVARDALFVSKLDWNTTQSTANNATPVDFKSEQACIQVSLDVTGTIGAMRFPDYMYYDANVRGGAFILDASADGATWATMVATSGGATLGRDGTMAPSAATAAAGNAALTYKTFSIALAAGTYKWPTTLGTPVVGGGVLRRYSAASCSVVVGGSGWSPASNATKDFNVHLVASGTAWPYWTPGTTKFNGVVTGYNTITGVLSFSVTPDVYGSSVFVVFVRSGEGTGVLSPNGPIASVVMSVVV